MYVHLFENGMTVMYIHILCKNCEKPTDDRWLRVPLTIGAIPKCPKNKKSEKQKCPKTKNVWKPKCPKTKNVWKTKVQNLNVRYQHVRNHIFGVLDIDVSDQLVSHILVSGVMVSDISDIFVFGQFALEPNSGRYVEALAQRFKLHRTALSNLSYKCGSITCEKYNKMATFNILINGKDCSNNRIKSIL
jgi:hypothetical protein